MKRRIDLDGAGTFVVRALLGALALGCAFGVAGALGGCSEAPPECPEQQKIAGVCAGVPLTPVCDAPVCTGSLSCSSVIEVHSAVALASAVASATSGACIALHPGAYPPVQLPGDVSLLGRGADHVFVKRVIFEAGSGATLRGLTVGAGGVRLDGAQDVRIEAVRIAGAAKDGLVLEDGASAELSATTIEASGRYGLFAVGSGDLDVETSVIRGSEGPGLWMACPDGCACDPRPQVTLAATIIEQNRIAGVSLAGVAADLGDVRIGGTLHGKTYFFGEQGGGLAISACSEVTAHALTVEDNASFGILVDGSTALLGEPAEGHGVDVRNNVVGVWIQGETGMEQLHVENATIEDNRGIGIGFGGDTQGFIVCKTKVTGTQLEPVVVAEGDLDVGEVDEMGDGIVWLDGAQAVLEEVTLSGNSRQSLLIDGPVGAGSTLASVTLADGDEAKGIVQQRLPAGGQEPQTGPGVPEVQTSTTQQFSIPLPPIAPAAVGQ